MILVENAELFDAKYRASTDPWLTQSEQLRGYYDFFRTRVGREPLPVPALLDVGCGDGMFSLMLADLGIRILGVDISPTAVGRANAAAAGRPNPPRFRSFDILGNDFPSLTDTGKFGAVVCSQVLYYYQPNQVQEALQGFAAVLMPGGKLFIMNNSQGTRYNLEEMIDFVRPFFTVLETGRYDHHYYLIATTKQPALCLTIDYEAWEYPPESGRNRKPDLFKEVIGPTERLMQTAEKFGCRLTLFVEVAQLAFWDRYVPGLADPVKDQVREAFRRGHDVQLHLHPRWLTSLGARYDEARNAVIWPDNKSCLAQLTDAELEASLNWAHGYLCDLLAPVDDAFRPTVFRAGKYQIQPHRRVFQILERLGYEADTSVWQGGYLASYEGAPGFDFRHLWTTQAPYWPTDEDINIPRGNPGIGKLLELPIYSESGKSLNIDTLSEGDFRSLLAGATGASIIAIGHSKNTDANLANIEASLAWAAGRFALTGLRHLARDAVKAAGQSAEEDRVDSALKYYARTMPSMEQIQSRLGDYHRRKQEHVEGLIAERLKTQDRVCVLDFGCGTGELFTLPLAWRYKDDPRVEIIGYDVDPASTLRGQAHAVKKSLKNLRFTADLASLPAGSFDVVCNLEVLEHLTEPQPIVDQLAAVVKEGGVVYVTVPNGYGPGEIEGRLLGVAKQWVYRSRWLLALAVRIKRLLLPSGSLDQTGQSVVTETLHVTNNVHVQAYRIRDILRMAAKTPLRLARRGNTAFLVGLVGSVMEKFYLLRRANGVLARCAPTLLASGWWFDFVRAPGAGESKAR